MLRISAKVDYGLRAIAVIAGAGDGWVKANELARDEGIPPRFLGATLTELRKAGFVGSRRGSDGGYRLARRADEITVAEVIEALEGGLVELPLVARGSVTAALWDETGRCLGSLFGSVTIGDLVARANR